MNGDILRAWLLRLETEEQRRQARSYLHPRPGMFCGIGLLVDLYVRAGKAAWKRERPGGVYNLNGVESVLPPVVSRWAGLSQWDALQISLRNDGNEGHRQHTFKMLAEYIRANIKEDTD